jgi:hypothetical protein
MSDSRKKPGVAFWATVVVVVLLVVYPLSFGPACWLADRQILPRVTIARIFSPLLDRPSDQYVAPHSNLLIWWANLGARRDGIARRLWCIKTAHELGCGTIDGCDYDDFQP